MIIMSVICKEFEHLLKNHNPVSFLVKHQLNDPNQHGFPKIRPCLTNLLLCFKEIKAGTTEYLISSDKQKSFDKVPDNDPVNWGYYNQIGRSMSRGLTETRFE